MNYNMAESWQMFVWTLFKVFYWLYVCIDKLTGGDHIPFVFISYNCYPLKDNKGKKQTKKGIFLHVLSQLNQKKDNFPFYATKSSRKNLV